MHSIFKVKLIPIFLLSFLYPHSNSFAQPSYNWISTGIGGGGALFSPSFNPHNPDELYTASDLGGLYHTENLGQWWDVVPFWKITTTTHSRMNFTNNPNIQYCVHSNGYQFIPKKTTDGGGNWFVIPGDPTFSEAWNLFADPNNAERLLIASYSELFFSNDGGNSFESVYSAPDLYLGGVFWNGDNIFVGCRTGLLVSEDGGNSFNLQTDSGDLPNDFGMLSLTGASDGNTIRLFCVARNNQSMWPGMQGSEFWADQDVFRMDWGNSTGWQLANSGIPIGDFPFFIDMAQNNIDIVYVAGASNSPVFPLVYKSSNGGQNWSNVFLVEGNENISTGWQCIGGDENWWWGANAMGFDVASNDPNRVVISDFGFIHGTTDGGQLWRQMYVRPEDENGSGDVDNEHQSYRSVGMEQTSCWWVHWSDWEDVFVGFSDITGIRSENLDFNMEWHWSFDYVGNDWNSTYHMVEDEQTEILYAAVSDIHDIYQSTRLRDNPLDNGDGAVLYSTDKGKTWELLHHFGHPVIWLALDPNNPSILYASVIDSEEGDIYVTEDLHNGPNANWSRLTSPPRTEGHPFNIHVLEDGTLLTTYSGRIDGNGSFTESSGVFISDDGGNSWQDRSHPDMVRWTKDLTFPSNGNDSNWYVGVFSHWGAWPNEVGGLYRTQDRGLSWELLGDFYRVESCFEFSGELYVTTETEGLWHAQNGNDPNPDFTLVESYPFAHPTRVFFNPYVIDAIQLCVTSFGNGLRCTDPFGTSTDESFLPGLAIFAFPNPASEVLTIQFDEPGQSAKIELFDLSGKNVYAGKTKGFSSDHQISIDGLTKGIYVLKIAIGTEVFVEKVLVE